MSIELTTWPFTAFSATPDEITFSSIQTILEQAYISHRADPSYLFLHVVDRKLIAKDFATKYDRLPRIYPPGHALDFEHMYQIRMMSQILNHSTGTHIHMIELPDATIGTLLFGFFKY